jgi:hypothetical protein
MLKRLWASWKRLAMKIARFNSLVLCTILYVFLLPLVAIPFRLFKDPLRLDGPAGFVDREEKEASLEDALRQG